MTKKRTIAVAAAGAALLCAPPAASAAAPTIGVEDNFFSPAKATTAVGAGAVTWIWDLDGSGGGETSDAHNVLSNDGLFGSALVTSGSYRLRPSAGSFRYYCILHQGMLGKLRVKPRARLQGRRIKAAWSFKGAQTGNRYDVMVKRGARKWEPWLEATKQKRGKLGAAKRGTTYRIKARSARGRGGEKRSAWSPPVRIRVPR